jgi:hypothetical protein
MVRDMAIPLALAAAAALIFGAARRLLAGGRRIAGVLVRRPTDDTRIDADGAVRSVQGAEIVLPEGLLGEEWSDETLERLARSYWAS